MKFSLDALFDAQADGTLVPSGALVAQLQEGRPLAEDVVATCGRIALVVDGEDVFGEHADPVVRLVDSWLRKLPWVISGDTETVALRNSEQCFAFVPAAESVEISFFHGSEAEIEEYVTEPLNCRLDVFVRESLAMGQRVLDVVRTVDAELLQANEDCRDLQTSLDEAKRAWHDYELHNRR